MNRKDMTSQAKQKEDQKSWDQALDIYEILLSEGDLKNPDVDVLERCAWCASRAARYKSAIEYFSRLSEIEPKKAKWFYCIGYQFYMQKNWNEANKYFEKALELYPNYLIAKYRYGYSLRQLCGNKYALKNKNYWLSLEQFQECEQIWNNYSEVERQKQSKIYADICFQKGKLLIERNRFEEAILYFKTTLTLSKDVEECLYQLSKTYLSIGELQKAKETLPKKSSKYYIQELKSDILLAEGKFDEAKNILEKILQTRKKDYLYRKMSDIFIRKNDYLFAIKFIMEAEKINPQNHITALAKARLLFHENLLKAAKEELLRAIKLKKDNYASDFTEAETLLSEVQQKIFDKQYLEDDNNKLELFKNAKRPLQRQRFQGKIIKYNAERGFGFIKCKEETYFFHISSVKKSIDQTLCVGNIVNFDVSKSDKGLSAINIYPLCKQN